MLWATDIETADWTKIVCWCAVNEKGEVYKGRSGKDWSEWYLRLPECDRVIAHNGGGYDFIALISLLKDNEWSAVMSGSRIIACRIDRHATLIDSYALFPLSLAKWTGQKDTTGLDCECGNDCGGYCAIKEDLPPDKMDRLVGYCENDCRILLHTYQEDVSRLESLGFSVRDKRSGDIRLTVGSLAYNTAIDWCPDVEEGLQRHEWNKYNMTREAYYGGRTECFRTFATSGYRYDINSAYPYALTLPVPVGQSKLLNGKEAGKAYNKDIPGLYAITGYQKESRLALLPRRGSRGNLLWATGTIQGIYAKPELDNALKYGLSIERFNFAMIWPKEEAVYRPFVERLYAEREKCKRNGDDRFATVLKWIGNSLTGKLAQQTVREELFYSDMPPYKGRFKWLGGNWYISVSSEIPSCARPWHAAYLTARTRVTLYERLRRNNPIYCDTDSTYLVNSDDKDCDDFAFGKWKYEGTITDWRCLAPKVYRFKEEDGEVSVKGKGFPGINDSGFNALMSGEAHKMERGVKKIREAIRSGGELFQRNNKVRKIRRPAYLCGTRYVQPTGETECLHNENGQWIWPGTSFLPAECEEIRKLL